MQKKLFTKFDKSKLIKASVWLLELLFVFLVLYLVILPLYPELKYRLSVSKSQNYQDIEFVAREADKFRNQLPAADNQVIEEENSEATSSAEELHLAAAADTKRYPDRLIISKIGVNSPIIVTENEAYGLSLGSWLIPSSSRPNLGGNTVITGHRFRYLPPNNLTLYLLHKLEIGDIFLVVWQGEDYFYRVKDIKIVDPTDASPHRATEESVLTIYTCHPIYSTAKRLVVTSELVTR